MKASAAGRAAVWTAAASASVVTPHSALVAVGIAAGKEVFDLVRARSDRISILAFVRAVHAGSYLRIDPSGVAPGLILQAAASSGGQSGDVEGAHRVPDDEEFSGAADTSAGFFCVQNRADWLSYARSLTKNWADADDAVQHAAERILWHDKEHGTLCPVGKDPVGYAKKTIANYIIDRHRRVKTQEKYAGSLLPMAADVADDVLDRIIAKDARNFVGSLKPQERWIAALRWIEGLEPKEISDLLDINVTTVRTSLHRISRRMRKQLGVAAKPETILREGTT